MNTIERKKKMYIINYYKLLFTLRLIKIYLFYFIFYVLYIHILYYILIFVIHLFSKNII